MTKSLAIVVHFHQPVGNLDAVVRRATDRCYRPFLETLIDAPDVPVTLHYSGCLLEWLEAHAPDVTQMLAELTRSGRLELLTGGFYEPILAALPERDRRGQIEMMTAHLTTGYAARPTGLWLTERVWESDVVPSLIDAGVRYTVVDDTMFHSVGITGDELTGAFVTEHDGRPLLVYAGDRELRYLIPYRRVERVLERLQRGRDGLFVYSDDGEKFGEWPDTYERVYPRGWLRSFFERLSGANDWLTLTTLGAHAATTPPVGRAYLPSSSYDEMMTWALPARARLTVGRMRRELHRDDPEGVLPFVKGAPWRSFLAKYPEVNALQKRMLDVSRRVQQAGTDPPAVRELYRAQCNCAYWHGAFGGVYLGFMRSALWHHLMRAERDALGPEAVSTEVVDLDADGRDEVVVRGRWGAAVVAPALGGLSEIDDHSFGANLLAVAARHREAYHIEDESVPEERDEDEMAPIQARVDVDRESLVFDRAPFGGALDLLGGTRVDGPWRCEVIGDTVHLGWNRDRVRIDKEVRADEAGVVVTTTVMNDADVELSTTLGSETAVLPLSLGREVEPDKVEATPVSWSVCQPEGEVGLRADFEPAGDVAWSAIETAAASLEGLQLLRQGTIVRIEWAISIAARETFTTRVRLQPVLHADPAKRDLGVGA